VTITPRDARGEEGGATASLVREAAAAADGDVREGIGAAAGERTERALATLAVPGSSAASGDAAGEYASYLQRLRGVLQGSIQYPAGARRRGLTGTVRVQIVVRPTGDVESAMLVGSSSHLLLDQAALEAVRALRPLPFPPELPRRALRVELPIVFELR
jgi:protein TonB